MKKFYIHPIFTALVVSAALGLAGPITAFAATTPSLGTAATYGLLTGTFNYNTGLTRILGTAGQAALGYVGAFPGGGATLFVNGTTQVNNAAYNQAGTDQNTALNNVVDGLNIQAPCTSLGAIVDLATAPGHPTGVYTAGCYSSTGTMNVAGGATVTLTGPGTFIFRSGGALNTTAGSIVQVAGGASACDVFWAPVAATTLGANSFFVGTDIDNAGITIGSTVSWLGRALAYGAALGTITADTDTITVPVCAVPPVGGPPTIHLGTLTVVKTVINDNGGTRTVASFPLFVNGVGVTSGDSYSFPMPAAGPFTVTETSNAQYARTFSGDCDVNGQVTLVAGDNKVCIITNNDIGAPIVIPPVPPLIDVVKVPSPLALPGGPGPVTYNYTVRNIGTVPMSNVTMIDDSCAPLNFVSGDTNGDSKLDLNEVWTYRCSTSLAATHTNIVVATGWANGISASDIATATVVVGVPIVPPLINVTKIPSPLALRAGGGMVTYTERITNPGTVPLSNVRLNDDKCSPMKFIFGDTNNDSKLDPSETWTYTCQTNLTQTTTNTAVATGQANGITVRDFAIATVVVATAVPPVPRVVPVVRAPAPVLHGVAPAMPKTGFEPTVFPWFLNSFAHLMGN